MREQYLKIMKIIEKLLILLGFKKPPRGRRLGILLLTDLQTRAPCDMLACVALCGVQIVLAMYPCTFVRVDQIGFSRTHPSLGRKRPIHVNRACPCGTLYRRRARMRMLPRVCR